MRHSISRWTWTLVLCLLAFASTAAAERPPLRWRLESGDVFHVELRQQIKKASELRTRVLQSLGQNVWNDTHELLFVFKWEVTDTQEIRREDGFYDTRSELTQTLTRVVFKMNVGNNIIWQQYDSEKPPADKRDNFFANFGNGLFDIHKKCKEHLDRPLKFWLSQRGHLEYDKTAVDWIAAESGDWFVKPEAVSHTAGDLRQTLLPEIPYDAETSQRQSPWEHHVKLTNLGQRLEQGKAIYTYTPLASRGHNVKIRLKGELDNDAAQGKGNPLSPVVTIEGFQSTGEINFDTKRGNVTAAKLNQLVIQNSAGIREAYQKLVQVTIRREPASARNDHRGDSSRE